MENMTEFTTPTKDGRVYGTRPVGSCRPGTHSWATCHWSSDDQRWEFTCYDAWLIESETKTDDAELAAVLDAYLAAKYEGSES